MVKLALSSVLLFSLYCLGAADRRPAGKIRVNVNLALVPVSVTDDLGRNVVGLARDNFRVLEGNQQMPIVSFSKQDQPVTVGLVFDCSGSMVEKFPTARQAPKELFQQLNADDESFLVTVSDRAELKHGLTSEFNELAQSLLFVQPKGTTSLIDGAYLALEQIRRSKNHHKALVIVSDGGDNNSRYNLRDLFRLAVESDTQIFAAGLFNNPQTKEEELGPSLLAQLCGRTGGAAYLIRNVAELHTLMGRIGSTLHNEYVLGYYPPAPDANPGKYRKITVKVSLPAKVPLHVYARSGYYLPQ